MSEQPDDDMPEKYWCVFCGRCIEPVETDGGNLYVHDNVPHPDAFAFDDDNTRH